MKLEQLAAKPKLVQIVIDDADIVEQFGETITFYTWDRQPMSTFIKMATLDQKDYSSIMMAMRELVLDEQGAPIINDDVMLPGQVMMRCITRIVEGLGKF
jgi:hypothetical protein